MLQKRSSGSVTIISIERERVIAALQEIAGRIGAVHEDVVAVRLFGSVARGDHVGMSDVDVLIVVRGRDPVEPLAEIRRFYPYFDLPVGVDLLVYSERTIDARLAAGDPFMTQIWNESRPLYYVRVSRE